MAPCGAGSGFDWALSSVIDAFDGVATLPMHQLKVPVEISLGSATNLPNLDDGSVTAVVVDPPYADNVQYSELADFFYVWLKHTQGHRRPDWFSTYLCEHDQEAVVNISRHREGAKSKRGARDGSAKDAREKANAVYQQLMTGTFAESRRILRDDGVLTVMFTHKKQEASDAVSAWRIQQLAERGLDGVEPEGRFALLCWDVLGAAEFRFNEARLLGHAVGMDVSQLESAGLVSKSGDKVKMLSARDRRRDRALEPDEVTETLFGSVLSEKKRTKKDALKVHPNDPQFRTAIDACHALALRYLESSGGNAGIGSARSLVRQQRWAKDSNAARLMEALVHAAPQAVRFEKGKTSAAALYPEFRAWHALLEPLFGLEAPEWKKPEAPQGTLFAAEPEAEYGDNDEEDEQGSDDR